MNKSVVKYRQKMGATATTTCFYKAEYQAIQKIIKNFQISSSFAADEIYEGMRQHCAYNWSTVDCDGNPDFLVGGAAQWKANFIPGKTLGFFYIYDTDYWSKDTPQNISQAYTYLKRTDRLDIYTKYVNIVYFTWEQHNVENNRFIIFFTIDCHPKDVGDQCINNSGASHINLYNALSALVDNTLSAFDGAAYNLSGWPDTRKGIATATAMWKNQTDCYKNSDYLILQNTLIPGWTQIEEITKQMQTSLSWKVDSAIVLQQIIDTVVKKEKKWILDFNQLEAWLKKQPMRIIPKMRKLKPAQYPVIPPLPFPVLPPHMLPVYKFEKKSWELGPTMSSMDLLIAPGPERIVPVDTLPWWAWIWAYVEEIMAYFDVSATYLENYALLSLPILFVSFEKRMVVLPAAYLFFGLEWNRLLGQADHWFNHSPIAAEIIAFLSKWKYKADQAADLMICAAEINLFGLAIAFVSWEMNKKIPELIEFFGPIQMGAIASTIVADILLAIGTFTPFPNIIYDLWKLLPNVFVNT